MTQAAKDAQKNLADVLFPVRPERSDEDDGILSVPLNERRLQTETYDFTISTLYSLLKENQIMVPEFQRKYVWTRIQASRLIESLIIQCPIPVIYLDQELDGTLKVIDGNQRLWSIRLFIDNGFKLRGLKAFPDLNGLYFKDLDHRFRTHIENRTIRCITILKETHPQIKFDVFERLNTGSVSLNPQELRHGLYHGRLMELLDELGEYEPWVSLSGIKNDKRMKGAELILRFLALSFNLAGYEKPLATFLNKFAEGNRKAEREEEFVLAFQQAVGGVTRIFGNEAFRIYDENGLPDNNFNAAVFDAQMVGFHLSGRDPSRITERTRTALRQGYKELTTNRDYIRAISASTSDPPLVRSRIGIVRALVERNLTN